MGSWGLASASVLLLQIRALLTLAVTFSVARAQRIPAFERDSKVLDK
jgi:hypothetical protein